MMHSRMCPDGRRWFSVHKATSTWLQTGFLPSWCHMTKVVQSLSCVQLLQPQWTTAGQASLSLTISQSLLKLMSIELMMPSNHLILCSPLLLLPSIFPSIRVFSNESALRIRRPGRTCDFPLSQAREKPLRGSVSDYGLRDDSDRWSHHGQ